MYRWCGSSKSFGWRRSKWFINSVSIGRDCLENISIDFGLIDEEGYINGLLGLDVLLKLGMTINLKELKLYRSYEEWI